MASCEKCYKYHNQVASKECNFCRDYSFKENILCDLLQSEHRSYEVECYAFRHNLSVVGETNKKQDFGEIDNYETRLTDKHKWLKAYAIQQWKYDENEIFCDLNYHLCLLANNRNAIIQEAFNDYGKVSAVASDAGDEFKGKVSLLCIGEDHIHLHINSSPDYSADEVVKMVIAYLETAIKSEFQDTFKDQERIFQKTYFIETIG